MRKSVLKFFIGLVLTVAVIEATWLLFRSPFPIAGFVFGMIAIASTVIILVGRNSNAKL